MNVPTKGLIDQLLAKLGSDSTMLGNGSIGLIAGNFVPTPGLKLSDIVEADFTGYTRKSFGSTTVTFTSPDGNEYIEGNTQTWMPSDTVTPNTITGIFFTPGNDTTTLICSDKFAAPIYLPGPGFQITVTPRVGINPANNFGLNVISN